MTGSSDNGEHSNSLFFKLVERTFKEGKNVRSSVLFGLSDIHEAIQNLKKAFDPESAAKMPESYATLPSKLFEHKSYLFYSKENDYGRCVTIKESYKQGIRMETSQQVLIAEENLQSVINELETHVAFAAKYDES